MQTVSAFVALGGALRFGCCFGGFPAAGALGARLPVRIQDSWQAPPASSSGVGAAGFGYSPV